VAEHIERHFSFYCFLGILIQRSQPQTYENVEWNIILKIFFLVSFILGYVIFFFFFNQAVCHIKSIRPENLQEKFEKATLK